MVFSALAGQGIIASLAGADGSGKGDDPDRPADALGNRKHPDFSSAGKSDFDTPKHRHSGKHRRHCRHRGRLIIFLGCVQGDLALQRIPLFAALPPQNAPEAQLDRASDYEAKNKGFSRLSDIPLKTSYPYWFSRF